MKLCNVVLLTQQKTVCGFLDAVGGFNICDTKQAKNRRLSTHPSVALYFFHYYICIDILGHPECVS